MNTSRKEDTVGGRVYFGRSGRKAFRKLFCIAVSALALILVLSPMLTDSDSSADANDNTIRLVLYDADGQELTSPLINDPIISFSTLTTPDGVVYELSTGDPIESCPAYFVIRADSGTGHGLFKVSVKIEGLDGTWADNFGIRVCTDNGSTADLTKSGNSYESLFYKGGLFSTFEMNKRYGISFATLEGSCVSTTPIGDLGNFTVILEAEPIPEFHTVLFLSDNELVEQKLLRDIDVLGEFPDVQSQGRDPIGWIDYDGHIVTGSTMVSDLPTDMVIALYGWPIIIEWQEQYIDEEGSKITDKIRKEINEDTSYTEDTSKTTEYKDGKVKEETTHTEKDAGGDTYEYETKTDIVVHDDGKETHITSTEEKINGTLTETSQIRTEYDSNKVMTEEEKKLTVIDSATGEREEYDVTVRIIDPSSSEKKYKISGALPEAGASEFDKMKSLIDEYSEQYNCEAVAVGMKSDDFMTVSNELLGSFVDNGYSLFKENGDGSIRIELDKGVVKWMHDSGSEVKINVGAAKPGDLTEEQRRAIGDNYAVKADVTLGGLTVSALQGGKAELTVNFDKASAVVYYIDSNGSSELVECTFNSEMHTVTFTTDRLSVYMIQEEQADDLPLWPFYVTPIAEYILIILIFVIYCRKFAA